MKTVKQLRLYTYIGALFMATYSSLPAYINSSFLTTFLPESRIGWLYALTSFITIIFIIVTPKIISTLGNRRTLILFTSLSLLSLLPLAISAFNFKLGIGALLVAFGFYITLGYLTRYALDVYLENISDDKNTGLIRGLYLSFYNLAWFISPFVAATLANTGNYGYVYGLASLLLLPFLAISLFGLQDTKCQVCTTTHAGIRKSVADLWSNKTKRIDDVRHILVIDFLLNFFYAIMVVYMPLYLHNHLGLPWSEIGLIFTIMLLPFVLLQLPLGKISDRWLGEKEILLGGLIIIASATIACALLQSSNWILWAGLLFLTRLGAASIEIMKETYLFKKITGADMGIVALSRINVPLSYLIGPIFATSLLFFFDMQYLFLGLGLVLVVGLKFAWKLEDTK